MIKEEYESVRLAANKRVKQANLALKLSGDIMRYQNTKLQKLEKLAKRKTVPTETRAVQFSVRDVFDIPEVTDIQAYFESVNSFIVGGQIKNVEWAIVLISDIFSQKLWADYNDFKQKRELCTLKVFVLQYFFKQFGCRTMAITLLRDFLATLKAKFLEEQRIETFLDLCGHAELKHTQNVDIKLYLSKNEVVLDYRDPTCPDGAALNLRFLFEHRFLCEAVQKSFFVLFVTKFSGQQQLLDSNR